MDLQYYFEVLNLPLTYDLEIINKKYRELMKNFHPDINHEIDSEAKAIEINIAYHEIKKYIKEKKGVLENNDTINNDSDKENDLQNSQINSFTEEIIRDLNILSLSLKLAIIKYKRFCLKLKEEYNCFIDFNEYLKMLKAKEKLVKAIGLKEKDLLKKYKEFITINGTNFTFNEWLQIKLREKNALKKLKTTYKTSLEEYKKYLKNLELNKKDILTYVEWLEKKVKEQKMLDSLNMTYETAHDEYNYYCICAIQNGYSFYTFSKWLEILYSKNAKTYRKKV